MMLHDKGVPGGDARSADPPVFVKMMSVTKDEESQTKWVTCPRSPTTTMQAGAIHLLPYNLPACLLETYLLTAT